MVNSVGTFKGIRRFVLGLAILGIVVCIPLYALKIARKRDYSDFDVYYRTAQRAEAGNWVDVYNPQIDGNCPYRYAPPTILLFKPFTSAPLETARVYWYFLQVIFYALGFFTLHHVNRRMGLSDERSRFMLALTFLFVLRFCLDSFTIGQISGLMFACFSLALLSWLREGSGLMGLALSVPMLLKVGPGILYGLNLSSWPKDPAQQMGPTGASPRLRRLVGVFAGLLAPFALLIAAFLLTALWLGDGLLAQELWKSWVKLVAADSSYFDNSHYGSQSIKSALLRMANLGWWTTAAAERAWFLITAGGVASVAWFWVFRAPRSLRTRGLFFSLGILVYLLFMPATFQYSQPFLAFPVLMLLARPLSRLGKAAIFFGFATLSLAGLDIVGSTVFFALQKASVPVFAMLLIAAAVVHEAWRDSEARWDLAK